MALGPLKFVRDMGSSSHRGLIMAQGQEANCDNLANSFRFSTKKKCCILSVLIRIASTYNFMIKQEIF